MGSKLEGGWNCMDPDGLLNEAFQKGNLESKSVGHLTDIPDKGWSDVKVDFSKLPRVISDHG